MSSPSKTSGEGTSVIPNPEFNGTLKQQTAGNNSNNNNGNANNFSIPTPNANSNPNPNPNASQYTPPYYYANTNASQTNWHQPYSTSAGINPTYFRQYPQAGGYAFYYPQYHNVNMNMNMNPNNNANTNANTSSPNLAPNPSISASTNSPNANNNNNNSTPGTPPLPPLNNNNNNNNYNPMSNLNYPTTPTQMPMYNPHSFYPSRASPNQAVNHTNTTIPNYYSPYASVAPNTQVPSGVIQNQPPPPPPPQQQPNMQWQNSENNPNPASTSTSSSTPPSGGVRFVVSPQNKSQKQPTLPSSSIAQPSPFKPLAGSNNNNTSAIASDSNSHSTPNDPKSWPPKLRAYVERAFDKCQTAHDRIETEEKLKKKITEAIGTGALWAKDWDLEPLPLVFVSNAKPKSATKAEKKLKNKEKKKMAKRKNLGGEGENNGGDPEQEKKKWRTKRFVSEREVNSPINVAQATMGMSELEWDSLTIVGNSIALEKKYLRLTSAPDPATVRPEPVLREAIKHLKDVWKKNQDYAWVCDQLKAVRQDLTVQRIKGQFAVDVYELHARLALEAKDLGEFNQCQTQLKELYKEGDKENEFGSVKMRAHAAEFCAYRILYYIHTNNQGDIAKELKEMSTELKNEPAVSHALKVREAVALNNYHRFFILSRSPPNMSGEFMDIMSLKIRKRALKVLCKAIKPSIPVSWLATEFGFPSFETCKQFLDSVFGDVCTKDGDLDIKAASSALEKNSVQDQNVEC